MQKLDKLIPKRMSAHKLEGASKAAEVIYFADQKLHELLPEAEEAVQAVSLKNTVLWVATTHSSWNQEVWGIAEKLTSELQKKFGPKIVQKIRTKTLTSS